MATPYSYADCIRVHDMAVFNWLRRERVDYPNVRDSKGTIQIAAQKNFPTLCVMASPSRAYASLVDLLVELKWVGSDAAPILRERAKDNIAVLPLPAFSFQRANPAPDPTLANVPARLKRRYYNRLTGQWEDHPFPMHMKTNYTVTVWTVKRFSEAFLQEAMFSELGQLGARQNEVLIPVVHPAPWGTINQSLVLESPPSDMTELEGDEPRYIRYEYTMALRTWLFRNAEDAAEEVQTIQDDADAIGLVDDINLSNTIANDPDIASQYQSENLFRIPFGSDPLVKYWPLSGDAADTLEAAASETGFDVTLTERDDRVSFVDRYLPLDTDGAAILGIAIDYESTDEFELAVGFRDPRTEVVDSAYSAVLESVDRPTRLHRFVLVKDVVVTLRLAGMRVASDIRLRKVQVRHITSLTQVVPTSTILGGGVTRYEWTGLLSRPYLIVLQITATSGGLNTVTAEDDVNTPLHTESQIVDSYVNAGAVFLIQPRGDSLALTVPDTTTVAKVYVQTYQGYYNGRDV